MTMGLSTLEQEARICVYVYMSAFSVTALSSILCAFRVFTIAKKGWTITKVVHILIPFCLLARTLDFTINYISTGYHMFIRPSVAQNVWAVILASFPVYLFFTTYILVCLSWYYIYHRSFQRSPALLRQIFQVYLVINSIVYSCWAVLMVFISFPHMSVLAHRIETYFAISISILAGVAFAYFGYQLHSRVRKAAVLSHTKLAISKKVRITAGICASVFLLRAVLIFVSYSYLRTAAQMFYNKLIPCIAVLVLTGNIKKIPTTHINPANSDDVPFVKKTQVY